MTRLFSALTVVLLSSLIGGVRGGETAVQRTGAQPISLRAMIASGQTRVVGASPESEKRLIRTLELREKAREAEVEIFRRTEAILLRIKRRADSQSVSRLVTIESVEGKGTVTGTLIDFDRGLAVTALDGLSFGTGEVHVTLLNGKQYTGRLRTLSATHNLAFVDPGDDFKAVAEDIAVASEDRGDQSASLVPGAFLGAATREGKWIFGSVTSLEHFDEEGIDPIVRGSLNLHWERSGIPVSARRTGFEGAIVCDLPIAGEQCGGPVYSLHAGFAGVAVSRTDQHEAILMPVQVIENLLNSRR